MVVLLLLAMVGGRLAPGSAAPPGSVPAPGPAALPGLPGLPDGVAEAALRPAPTLPVPTGWPFPEAFPKTSGVGRLAGGALEWSDFIADDHGAQGIAVGSQVAPSSRWSGTYTYGDAAARNNGADIFRVGIGLRDGMTFWRVDWSTLEDARIPVVAFGLAAPAGTGAPVTWPAGAGVRSSGLQAVVVASSRGAWLIDGGTGARQPLAALGGGLTVDPIAKSFVVTVPRAALPAAGSARVAAVSGMANAAGDGFAPVTPAQGALPGQPAVYNAAFRGYEDEPPLGNAWFEKGQAAALTAGDISAFTSPLDWDRLARAETTPEPLPTGYTNRWYASSIAPGAGIVTGGTSSNDGTSNLAGRVLPYGVYVPSTYSPERPAPLTWTLHSLGYLHNQYSQLTPKFLQLACEARGSICASPSGRSPSNPWYGDAELDFWEVWRDVAGSYALDPERTVISGYSMGGLGTFRIGLAYPSAFTQAVSVAGGLDCGVYVTHGVGIPGAGQPCMGNGNFTTILPSARWLPIVLGSHAADELSPAANAVQRAQELEALGYRYRLELWTTQDHLSPLVTDGFASIAKAMSTQPRPRDPGRVTYTWYPNLVHPAYGLGPTSVHWLSALSARTSAPGSIASIDGLSGGRPDPAFTLARSTPAAVTEPGEVPKVVTEATWTAGPAPGPSNRVSLQLTNVARASIDGKRAGLDGTRSLSVDVTSDGSADLTIDVAIPAGSTVTDSPAGCAANQHTSDGALRFSVGPGTCTVRLSPPAPTVL